MVMDLSINQDLLEDFPSSKQLVAFLKEEGSSRLNESVVYFNFPLYIDNDNNQQRSDILVVSKKHGILLFKTKAIDNAENINSIVNSEVDSFSQIYSLVFSKLIRSKLLQKNPTTLDVNFAPAVFLFSASESVDINEVNVEGWSEVKIVNSQSDLNDFLDSHILSTPLSTIKYNEIVSILEGSKGIISHKRRVVSEERGNTKGKLLNQLEQRIATFDFEQKRVALQILNKAQRIRGLAGSGKTIILAMKAAQIHITQPDAKILYTFWTKSLYDFIKNLITIFYRQFADRDPDWNKIMIMHAWGGKNLDGVYYKACQNNGIKPKTYGAASKEHGKKECFDFICQELVKESPRAEYDYVIMDEAQDFPIWFYRLCYMLAIGKKIIWGYDECQNILDMNIQDPKTIFGVNPKTSKSIIDIADYGQDIVLHKCYRNIKQIIVTAFSLGLGIYNDKIVQLPENMDMWEDLGFEVEKGNYKKDSDMLISRSDVNSIFIDDLDYDEEDFIFIKKLSDIDEEIKFVTDSIIKNINEEDLKPDDILVISLDNTKSKEYFSKIAEKLESKDINSFNVTRAPMYNTSFKIPDFVTLSSIYNAKGNESGMVYIVGAHKVFEKKDSIVERNKLFTAMTRAKIWVRLTGYSDHMEILNEEVRKLNASDLKLDFKMPDLGDLKVFQRDLRKRQDAFNRLLRQVSKISKETGVPEQELLDKWIEKNESD